jgi:hypothetical protein
MVLLPKKPGDPLKGVLKDFETWRDGGPINLTLPKPQFACEITRNFTSQDGLNTQFKQGMQGNMLEESDSPAGIRMALIFIQGVTPKNTWVPRSHIRLGVQLTGDINDWKIEFRHTPNLTFFRPQQSNNKLLRAITGLLEGFKGNPQTFTAVYSDYMSKHDIKLVAEVIRKGIQDSGLYGELSKDDCTLADLFNASRCQVNEAGGGKGVTGIYARFSKSKPNIKHWKPNTRFVHLI